jgi:hypothetical protein
MHIYQKFPRARVSLRTEARIHNILSTRHNNPRYTSVKIRVHQGEFNLVLESAHKQQLCRGMHLTSRTVAGISN